MKRYLPVYRPVEKGASIVDKDAYKDYRETSKIRDPKKFTYYTDYRRIVRKIWKKVAEDSVNYESGVYDSTFFYLVPQVVTNQPFIEMPNGKIKTNSHTNGDIYAPIFCNLFKRFDHTCWSFDGCFTKSYKDRLKNIIDKYIPTYYFILPLLKNNKF